MNVTYKETNTKPSFSPVTHPQVTEDYVELHNFYEELEVVIDKFLKTSSFKQSVLTGDPSSATFTIQLKH